MDWAAAHPEDLLTLGEGAAASTVQDAPAGAEAENESTRGSCAGAIGGTVVDDAAGGLMAGNEVITPGGYYTANGNAAGLQWLLGDCGKTATMLQVLPLLLHTVLLQCPVFTAM